MTHACTLFHPDIQKVFFYNAENYYDNVPTQESGAPVPAEDLCGPPSNRSCPPLNNTENIVGMLSLMFCLLCVAYCVLSIACCLLCVVYCVLSIVFCPLCDSKSAEGVLAAYIFGGFTIIVSFTKGPFPLNYVFWAYGANNHIFYRSIASRRVMRSIPHQPFPGNSAVYPLHTGSV